MKHFSLRRISSAVLALWLLAIAPVNMFAWGPEGHRIIALIAKKHLTPKARAAIRKLLPAGTSLDSVANWADHIRLSRPATAPWHFVDIPLSASDFDPNRDCQNDACVVEAINQAEETLADKTEDKTLRIEALKFLVHFVGDEHQPLHCADHNDRGGNTVTVKFFNQKSNLHKVWDSGIISHTKLSETAYTNKLNSSLSAQDVSSYQQGTIIDWALESHKAAVDIAYGKKPNDNVLDDQYYNDALPTVNEQLSKGGIRLAKVLNDIFQ